MQANSTRLILVSNRLPFQLLENDGEINLKQSDGGLVTALKGYFDQEAHQHDFAEKIWVGSADFPEKRWKKFHKQNQNASNFDIIPLFLDSTLYNKYYNGFCNATLWPLFHYFPSFVIYNQESFDAYEQVNQMFAEKLKSIVQPGDVVWIHDYQLFLLPGMLRTIFPYAHIGFFLHIPFPSFEIFRSLHRQWKDKIINGLLGADLIGFHTHEYVQHFLKTVRMVTGYDHHFRLIATSQRKVKAELFPLGIEFKKFHDSAKDAVVLEERSRVAGNFAEKKILFSVDRLDYTKGVTHRLAGFEKFLLDHPEWREKVVFILVVVPSRQVVSKYNERRKLIEEQVGSINGKFSTLSWQPVIYRYSHLNFTELCALYQAADVALVTPLRDGMNLVAKEFVASCADRQGVLILSQLAGAANELSEALLVNPLDEQEVANAIFQALHMPTEEQNYRLQMMQQRLLDYDVNHWVKDFLQQLDLVKEQQRNEGRKVLTVPLQKKIVNDFAQADIRNLLLDYDGTLVGFNKNPNAARPDDHLLTLLTSLASKPNTNVTIISGRDARILEKWFGETPVTLVAEHGASIKRANGGWVLEGELDQPWKNMIRPTFDMYVRRCPGSFVEEKNFTLAWHYRNVDPELGFIRSRELLDNLLHLVRNGQLQVIDGNKVIEVRLAGIDKGTAAKKVLDELGGNFALAIGDDKTDEDMFRVLENRAITVKVGLGASLAQYTLLRQHDVIDLLNKMAAA